MTTDTGSTEGDKLGKPWTVLLVEDNPDHVWMIRSTLTGSGRIDVVTARTAREARDAFGAQRFDAIITDQRLPDAEGLDLIKELREQGYDGTILLVTAQATEEMANKGLASGATDYVFKARGYPERLLEELLDHLEGVA